MFDDDDEANDPNIDPGLREAQQALETDGERFRKLIMKRLFDSPTSTAVHRPDGFTVGNTRRAAARGRGARGWGAHGCGRRGSQGHGRGARGT